jgi:hypothetical protein
MNRYLILGMAIQAFASGLLDIIGLIELCSGQQIIAGILFFVIYIVMGILQDGN